MMMFGKGERMKAEGSVVCVLYDPATGRILHMHQVTTFPGGRTLARSEIEARTFDLAKNAGVDVSKAKALHVRPEDYTPGVPHKVDVQSLRLVARPLPASPRNAG